MIDGTWPLLRAINMQLQKKSRLHHEWILNLSIELSQGRSLLFVSVLNLPYFCYYFKFNLGKLIRSFLGTSIIFNLHILITRISVIANKSIGGSEEMFYFFREILLTIKVYIIGGTILNWLQKKIRITNELKQHAG